MDWRLLHLSASPQAKHGSIWFFKQLVTRPFLQQPVLVRLRPGDDRVRQVRRHGEEGAAQRREQDGPEAHEPRVLPGQPVLAGRLLRGGKHL